MQNLNGLQPERVLKYFSEICSIPHGSGDTGAIADYCESFAKNHGLKCIRDNADNVIIFKNATDGYECAESVILQGHTDMVCQKDEDCDIDFLRDGISLRLEDDFLSAVGTTLGADNGIAVAMIFAILESDNIPHPALEVVLTSDEEVGMLGAMALDMSPLTAKRMINLDSEEDDTVTVSCAGGSDFVVKLPLLRERAEGVPVNIRLKGLKGGHSGVEINSGRENAVKLAARVFNTILRLPEARVIGINGGEKGNAIPSTCNIELCAKEPKSLIEKALAELQIIKAEISTREPEFYYEITEGESNSHSVLTEDSAKNLAYAISCSPNGVQKMSAEIKGLVETSLNLGILKTDEASSLLHISLRSNKRDALAELEDKLKALYSKINCKIESFGHYPPWEFKSDSKLQRIYKESYQAQNGKEPKVQAIHAGLECGVFSSKIAELDCISIGPSLFDVHTPKERLSIPSLQKTYELLLSLLKRLK